ncbi:unnamed protein product [Arctia plantaginis]|uniref:Ion transport domain-containing protein n=1 Tax=Arctia plantaginis TaxID=874455 RepID=A0A8S1BI80_ARCPL|nr:unnamed protein product [Arctia plantaginis]
MDEKSDNRKKAVSWYINDTTDLERAKKSINPEETEVVRRKRSGRRHAAKSKSLDPKQETRMIINSTKSVDQNESIYFSYEKRAQGVYNNSHGWSEISQPRTFPKGIYRIGKLNTRLLEAVENGDTQEVARLLALEADPNATCRLNHVSACHVAAMMDNNSLSLLIEAKAHSFRTDKIGRTPLHLAAWAGNPRQIAILLDLPEDLQNKVAVGICPETEKEIKKYSSVTHRLTNTPCNIGTLDFLPNSWLDSMEHNCRRQKENLPRFTPGWTALHSASARAQYTCVQLLLAAGADPCARDLIARTPLDVVGSAHYSRHNIDAHDFKETIRMLLAASGKFCSTLGNCLNNVNSPLHTAVELESKEAIEELLNAGASPICLNENGLTALHVCVEKRLKELLQFLANYEYNDQDPYLATVDAKDDMGQTVLHAAVRTNWTDGVCIALGAGASVFMKANDGDSPIHSAAAVGDIHILQHILSVAKYAIDYRNQKGQTALFVAIMQNNLEIVKILIDNGASLSIVLPDHQTVLHIAARYGYTDILEYLLNHENRIISTLMTANRCPPITYAVINNYPDCVRILLSKGDKLNDLVPFQDEIWQSEELTTVLHIAAVKNHFQIAKMIIEFDGETINKPNSRGLLPLHEACIRGHREIISLLIHKGADLSQPSWHPKIKQTPVEMVMINLSKPAAYMEEVFDSYIYNLQDKECQVTVNYAILVPRSSDGKQMKVLKALVDTGNRYDQRKLLHHPLVESFLYLKWRALVPFFYAIIALFGLFVISLNVYVVSVFFYQDKNKLNVVHATNYSFNSYTIKPVPGYLRSDVWKYMIYITASLVTLQEIIFIKINNRRYFLLLETWVKFGAIGLSIFLPSFVSWERIDILPGTESTAEWTRLIATIALLLSWLEFMFLLSRFPNWGFYVLMFGKVASKVFKILLTFMFLIIGFSLCFMIQFRAKPPFEGIWASITKTLVMMTSEYDYMSMINKEHAKDIAASILVLRLVFITFVILASIVFMNLMVGVAVNDVNTLADIGNQKRLEKQVDFLTSLEDVVCHKIFRKFNSGLPMRKKILHKIVLRPEAKCGYSKILPKYLRQSIFEKAQLQKKQMEDELGSMAYHLKLDQIHEAVVRKEEKPEQQEWTMNITLLNDTVEKINNDIEELRNELNVIRRFILRRASIH